MKIYNFIIKCMLCSFIVIGAASCTNNYSDYNQKDEDASQEDLDRDDYLVRAAMNGMQLNVVPLDVNMCQFIECLLGGSFGGYLADSNNGFNGKNFATYAPEDHWLRVPFVDVIPKMFINHAEIRNVSKNPVHYAVSDIIKVHGMSRVADIYGPIPYSKVGEDSNLNAEYDSEEEVYNKMFEELDFAIKELTENNTKNFHPKTDLVYKGNVQQWIKFANSLKLRLAMRLADVSPALAQKKAEEAVNDPFGVIIANVDNAFVPPSAKNPLLVVMYEYNGGDSRISADITSYMNGYNDPRREKYFTKSTFTAAAITNGFHGIRSGIQIPGGATAKQYSNMNVEEKDPMLWMNAAEVTFLRAEGALRGWSMHDTAENLYEKGIELSFEQWGASGADKYLADATSRPQVYQDPTGAFSFTGSASDITIKWEQEANKKEKNFERIITQKWIANFPLGIEAWSEYRRTGYPKLMPVMQNNSGGTVDTDKMARRLPYPQIEYKENGDNVQHAINEYLNGADNMGTNLWWAKSN